MDLLARIEEFHQLSVYGGMIEPPPRMVEAGVQFVMGAAAQYLLDQWTRKPAAREEMAPYLASQIGNKKNILASLITWARPFTYLVDIVEKVIPFDFTGWKTPFGDPTIVQRIMETSADEGVEISVEFFGNDDAKARWLTNRWVMQVYLGIPVVRDGAEFVLAVDWLVKEEAGIRLTIEHELIHMVQNIGMIIKNIQGQN